MSNKQRSYKTSIRFFYAFARRDLERSLYFWNQFQPSAILAQAQIFAAEASINVLKGDFKVASGKIAASRQEIPNMMDKGLGIALNDKLKELEDRIVNL